jgi:ribosome-binding factor A
MNERRIQRLQEQIKQRLAEVLQRDIADPKLGLVTVARVELDAEFTVCKAYWSVIATGPGGEARAKATSAEALARARGFCQREVGKSLATRTVPRLEFVFDEGIGGGIRINRLLRELQQEREQKDLPTDPGKPPTSPDNGA